jgi:hypothetical protein
MKTLRDYIDIINELNADGSDADMVKTTDGKTIWLNSEMTGSKTFNVAYTQ